MKTLLAVCCLLHLGMNHCAVVNQKDRIPDAVEPLVEDIKAQHDVDMKRFSGLWYEIYRTLYDQTMTKRESQVIYHDMGADGTLTTYITGTINGTCQTPFKAYTKPRCREGPAVYFTRLIEPFQTPWADMRILYTDYNVALEYFCLLQSNGRCVPGKSFAVISVRRLESNIVEPADLEFLKELLHNQTGIPPSDLIPTELEVDCVPTIQETVNGGANEECVFKNIDPVVDHDTDRIAGLWYPIRSDGDPKQERMSLPRCYKPTDDGNMEAFFITENEGRCEASGPLLVTARCPLSGRVESIVLTPGLAMEPGHPVYSIGKILYRDDHVAVLHICLAEKPDLTCDPRYRIYTVLSRTIDITSEQRTFIDVILRENCANLDNMIDIPQEGISCDCEDLIDEKSERGDKGSLACSPAVRPGPAFHMTRLLGLWYDYAGTKALRGGFLKDMDSMANYFSFGPHGTYISRYIAAKDGVCIPRITSIVEERCPDDKSGQALSSLASHGPTSWYLNKFVYLDNDLMIAAWCEHARCESLNPEIIRVTGRTPNYDNATRERVRSILQSYCVDPDTLIDSTHTVDCTELLFEDQNASTDKETEVSCKVDDIPSQENFTSSEFLGKWHLISTYNHWNTSSTSAQSGLLYYGINDNGMPMGYFSGRFQRNTSSCSPVSRIDMFHRCEGTPPEESMWQVEQAPSKIPKIPGAISILAGSWKVIYTDYQTAVVYVCQREQEDGTCDPQFTRVSILSRTWEIDEDDLPFLEEQVAKSCADITKLWRTTQEGDCFHEIDMNGSYGCRMVLTPNND